MTLVGLAARKLAQKQRTAKLAAAFPNGIRCQKCLNFGHWSYECKEKRKYVHRSSRTKQLSKHLAEKSTKSTEPMGAADVRSPDAGTETRPDIDKKLKRKKKRGNSSSSSSSSNSSENSSSDSSNSESSSSSDSDSSSSDEDDGSSSDGDSASSSGSESDGSSSSGKSSDSDDQGKSSAPKKKKTHDSSGESSDAGTHDA